MIYIFDNGEAYSNHALYFVDAPEDFGAWFNDVYRPWIDGAEYRPLMIVATAPAVERRERGPHSLRPIKKGYETPIEDEPMHEFSTMPVVDFLAKIVEQERDGEPRPRYRLEDVRPAGGNPGGMKQVTATCEKCGGPGITTEEGLKRSGGKLSHKDPAICANVRRNTGSKR
ncbi:MAG: hypothetical protein ABSF35_21410 [Polyangia bacterium]|jgi:hypothetical protein